MPGQKKPKTEGPSRMPAMISPITSGWPILLKRKPSNLENTTIVAICNNSRLSGCSIF